MSTPWIETYTGLKFEVLDPKLNQICITDIAHALSQICRFGGHTKFPYSVAQHSYLGSFLVPEEDALWFLLHDASEAYIGDMVTPLKKFTHAGDAYLPIEAKIMELICSQFGLPKVRPPSVHAADVAMLYAEKQQLMGPILWDRKYDKIIKPADVEILETPAWKVRKMFLKRFAELTKD